MTSHVPGATHAGGAEGFGDTLRRAVARDAGALEIELMVRRRWRAFIAAEVQRGIAGAAAHAASAGRWVAAVLRSMRHSTPALLLCLGFAAIPAAAAPETEAVMLLPLGDDGHGVLSVPIHTDADRQPAVVVVHDSLGRDSRAERYVGRLLERGVTVLEIEAFPTFVDGAVILPHLDDLDAARRVKTAADAMVAVAGANPRAIGALGFGAGARAVLLAAPDAGGRDPFLARALLYPGCETLRREFQGSDPALRGQVLLLHGGRDAGNTEVACAALAGDIAMGSGVRHLVIPQAGHAWDYEPAGAAAGPTLLPLGGAAGGRVAADPWGDATAFAADTVSGFLATALYGAMASAPRR
jgi:dienelactone hydrolase